MRHLLWCFLHSTPQLFKDTRHSPNKQLGHHTWSVPMQLYTVRLVPSLFFIYITEYSLYIYTYIYITDWGMSRQHRPLARHAGKLSSWFHLFEWMWSDEKKKSQEGCTKLAHVKIYKSIVLQKEELWIFFEFFCLSERHFSTYSFQMNNESCPICCYIQACLTMSSQCL